MHFSFTFICSKLRKATPTTTMSAFKIALAAISFSCLSDWRHRGGAYEFSLALGFVASINARRIQSIMFVSVVFLFFLNMYCNFRSLLFQLLLAAEYSFFFVFLHFSAFLPLLPANLNTWNKLASLSASRQAGLLSIQLRPVMNLQTKTNATIHDSRGDWGVIYDWTFI